MSKILASSNTSPTERHNHIMKLLKQQSSVSVQSIALQLKVSEVTIRKDLTQLEKEGKLYRSHGCANIMNPYISDRHVNEKEKLCAEEKQAIGEFAASLITPNDSIMIASGTTMLSLARAIKVEGHLTVITSAVNVSSILASNLDMDVMQLGGFVRNSSVSVVGPYAESILKDFSCSKLYMGVDGFDTEFGLTTTNLLEANLNRVMIKTAQRTIVLVDSSKFSRRGFIRICGIDSIDQVVTDSKVPAKVVEELTEAGIEVSIVNI